PDFHANTSPFISVTVIMVLLKELRTWAMPRLTDRLPFFRRATGASLDSVAWLSVLAAGRSSDIPRLPNLDPASESRCYLVAIFLPAIVLRGPLRVRAFVRVRWPRAGRLALWRDPR